MKRNTLLIILLIFILAIIVSCRGNYFQESDESLENSGYIHDLFTEEFEESELFREVSPDGNYCLLITEVRPPDFPFGDDHLKITLYEVIPEDELPRRHYRASFMADVATDGGHAGYAVEWLEDGVQVALKGSEQPTAYYILPFKALDD